MTSEQAYRAAQESQAAANEAAIWLGVLLLAVIVGFTAWAWHERRLEADRRRRDRQRNAWLREDQAVREGRTQWAVPR